MWRNWLRAVLCGMLPEDTIVLVHLLMQTCFCCLQNVSLDSSKPQHPETSVRCVLLTHRGWTLGLWFVPARMASTGPQPTPLLDPAQVTSPLDLNDNLRVRTFGNICCPWAQRKFILTLQDVQGLKNLFLLHFLCTY